MREGGIGRFSSHRGPASSGWRAIRPRISFVLLVLLMGSGSLVAGTSTGSATAPDSTPSQPSTSCFTYISNTQLAAVGLSAATSGCPYVNVADAAGNVSFDATRPPAHLNVPIVGITAYGPGYWLVAADGGVFAYGHAFFGSAEPLHLNAPVVGIASTPDGQGYYIVAADGGVFTFGDAVFQGSMAGRSLAAPIVGIAVDPLTGGYILVSADGGVFAFGTPFFGSMAGTRLNRPVVGVAIDSNNGGYWLASGDGGVFALGAPFWGAMTGKSPAPIVGISSLPDDYFLVDADGNISGLSGPPPSTSPGGIPTS